MPSSIIIQLVCPYLHVFIIVLVTEDQLQLSLGPCCHRVA